MIGNRRFTYGSLALCAVLCSITATLTQRALSQAVPSNSNLQQAIVNGVTIDQQLNAQIPLNATFQDETGKTVKIGDFFNGKPVVLVTPFYRCAGMCTLELDGIAKAVNAMRFTPGNEFNIVTLSIDPREQPPLAAEKKADMLSILAKDKQAGASAGWHFLVGQLPAIHQVTDAVGFKYLIDPKTKQPIHAVGIIILTPQGRVSRYLLGVDYSPRDLNLALVDASGYKIGGLAEKFILLCSHFDPTTSKYGVAIDRIIKFSCSLTVLILASFIFTLSRFERRRTLEQQEYLAAQTNSTAGKLGSSD